MASEISNLETVTKNFNDSAVRLAGGSFWFNKAKNNHAVSNFLTNINKIIQQMPKEESQKLKEKFGKIIPEKSETWLTQYDERFIDILIEILGFDYLTNQGYKTSFSETPDLLGYKDGQKAVAMECKNFWMSQCERNYLQSTVKSTNNITARKVEEVLTLPEFRNPFYRKFIEVIDKAKNQVNQINKTINKRIIFINFSFDAGAMLQKQEIKDKILMPEVERLSYCGITAVWFENYDLNQSLI